MSIGDLFHLPGMLPPRMHGSIDRPDAHEERARRASRDPRVARSRRAERFARAPSAAEALPSHPAADAARVESQAARHGEPTAPASRFDRTPGGATPGVAFSGPVASGGPAASGGPVGAGGAVSPGGPVGPGGAVAAATPVGSGGAVQGGAVTPATAAAGSALAARADRHTDASAPPAEIDELGEAFHSQAAAEVAAVTADAAADAARAIGLRGDGRGR